MGFQKGHKTNLGKKFPSWSEARRVKMVKALTGKHRTEEQRRRMSERQKGKHHSPQSEFKKGSKLTEETKKKISKALKGRIPKNLSQINADKFGENNPAFGKKPWNWNKERPEISGERHWNWKGGITPLTHLIRNCFEYRQWRSDVFTRDNFTCVLCGASGTCLEADHFPKLFSSVMKEYEIKTLEQALSCEELWNINNGRTLCKSCHLTKR